MTDKINYKDDPIVKEHLEAFREGAKNAFSRFTISNDPSTNYQDTLCKVCNYKDWEEFENVLAKTIYENKENPMLAIAKVFKMEKVYAEVFND